MEQGHKLAGPVLVATDHTAGGDEAVRQAATLARILDANGLHVCHALPALLGARPLFPHLKQVDAEAAASLEGRVAEQIGRRVQELTELSTGSIHVSVCFGSPHAAVIGEAGRIGAGLIVVGGARDKEPGFLASGTAELIVRYAHCPVLIARPTTGGMVLAGTDLSEASLPAVAAAAAEATRRETDMLVLHVLETLPLAAIEFGFAAAAAPQLHAWKQWAQGQLQSGLQRLRLEAEVRVVEGQPASILVDAARDLPAQLVVVGTRGKTGLSRLALGSVAEAVVRSAPCSVLVVRLSEG